MFTTVLLIAAFICFLLAALGLATGRVNLTAAGLACMALAQVFPRLAS